MLPGAVDDAGLVLDVVALVLERTTDANALTRRHALAPAAAARHSRRRAAAARSIKGAFPRAVARGRRQPWRSARAARRHSRIASTRDGGSEGRRARRRRDAVLPAGRGRGGRRRARRRDGAEAFAELLDAVPGRAGALAKAADTCAQALLEALPLLLDAAGQVDALVTHAVAAPQAQAVPCRVEHVPPSAAREKLGKDDALSLHQATLATADGGKLCFGGYVPASAHFVKGDLRGASSMRARNACEMVARGVRPRRRRRQSSVNRREVPPRAAGRHNRRVDAGTFE